MDDQKPPRLSEYRGGAPDTIAAAFAKLPANVGARLVADAVGERLPARKAKDVVVRIGGDGEKPAEATLHASGGEQTSFAWRSAVDAIRMVNGDLSLFGALTAGRCSLSGSATDEVVEAWGGTLGHLWRIRNGRPAALVRATRRAGIRVVLEETATSAAEMFDFDRVSKKLGKDFVLGWLVKHRRGDEHFRTVFTATGFGDAGDREPDVTFVFPTVPPFAAFASRKSNLIELAMGGAVHIGGDFGVVMQMSPPRW